MDSNESGEQWWNTPYIAWGLLVGREYFIPLIASLPFAFGIPFSINGGMGNYTSFSTPHNCLDLVMIVDLRMRWRVLPCGRSYGDGHWSAFLN